MDRRMLSMRIGERVNIMTEAARMDGPARGDHTDGDLPAPCVQLGSFRCESGAEPVGNSPEAFAEIVKREIARWGKVVQAAGVRAE